MPDQVQPVIITAPQAKSPLRYRESGDDLSLEATIDGTTTRYSVTHGTQDAAMHIESRVKAAGDVFARSYQLDTTYNSAKGWLELGPTQRYPIPPEDAATGIGYALNNVVRAAGPEGDALLADHPNLLPTELTNRFPAGRSDLHYWPDAPAPTPPASFPQAPSVNGRVVQRR